MNEIRRDIEVTHDHSSFEQISYVQGTNAIPIILHICDYNIPQGSSAKVYVERPDGTVEYDTAEISGNEVVISVKSTMFSVCGDSIMQIQITKGSSMMVSFGMKVRVKKNHINAGMKSENVVTIFEAAINEATEAAEAANNAVDLIEQKLENGDFIGEKGEKGDTGPRGETGPAGNIENIEDATVEFTQGSDRNNIISGEKISIILGKIQKWFADFKAAAFYGVVNNLLATQAGVAVLDAYQGKVLDDKITQLNSNLGATVHAFGEIGVDNTVSLYGTVSMQKLAMNKCNLTLNFKVVSRNENNYSGFSIDKSKICNKLGISTLEFNNHNTVAIPNQEWLASGKLTEVYAGYGMGCTQSGNYLLLGRIYNTAGAFGTYDTSGPYFTPGTIWTILINGATYT